MNWWKIKKAEIDDFSDRNLANRSIHKLTNLADVLRYAGELVYMTGRGARKMVADIAENKTLSTYPKVVNILEAADRIALDSPLKFKEHCVAAAVELENTVKDLEQQREDFVEKTLPARLKGLVENG